MKTDQIQDIIDHGIDRLQEMDGCDYASELHHHLYNEDYFIIGTHKAKEWMGNQAFDIIAKVQEYEQSNFGEVATDLGDPEMVASMYAYIVGEEILSHSDTLREKWDSSLDAADLKEIMCEIDAIPLHAI